MSMDQFERDGIVALAIMKAKSDRMYVTQDGTRLYVLLPILEVMVMFKGANFNDMDDNELNLYLVSVIANLMIKK